jgi:hypothetical protein
MVAARLSMPALLQRALSAAVLAVALVCALPSADAPAIKRFGSAFSADTADMAVLPARPAVRAIAASAAPDPLPPPLPVQVAIVTAPGVMRPAADWPRSRAPPPFARPGPVSQPRAPPTA